MVICARERTKVIQEEIDLCGYFCDRNVKTDDSGRSFGTV